MKTRLNRVMLAFLFVPAFVAGCETRSQTDAVTNAPVLVDEIGKAQHFERGTTAKGHAR